MEKEVEYSMIKMKKQILIIIMAVLLINLVSADNRAVCITKGQHFPCPNPEKVCKTDYCYFCVNENGCIVYDKNCPGKPVCGNNTIDSKPPVVILSSPLDNKVYNQTKVLFSLTTDELADLYYKDNSDDKGWKRLASKVSSFNKFINLKDGLNDITIKAADMKGNEAFVNRRFVIDSKKPKITKTIPSPKKFSSGSFSVLFKEANPKDFVLNYGNNIKGRKILKVNLNTCDNVNDEYSCFVNVSLNDYNGQTIDYFFELTDIANNSVISKPSSIYVDTAAPVFNNLNSMINVNGGYVYFNISINESNFESVSYYDDSKNRWFKLCSSLKNNLCTKKIKFSKGNYVLEIKAEDKAGNYATTEIEFNIV